ncbi:MAG: 3'-5' exonuclease [Waterburya sp.]
MSKYWINPDFDWDSIPDGSIHCDEARKYFRILTDENGKKRVVTPPEEKLDIFSRTSKVIPKWEPKMNFRKYDQLSLMIVDIETLAIDNALKDIRDKARKNRIMSIGVRNELGKNVFIQDGSERWMLEQLFNIIERKQPDVIAGHNSIWFDLPFIIERAKVLGVKCPFKVNYDKAPSRFAAAQVAGRYWNVEYYPIYITLKSGKRVAHIDTMMSAIAWDSVMRKMADFKLKTLPEALGLREDGVRLDLGLEGILDCYRRGDWDTLHEYLGDDLSDTHLLLKRFLPEIINQQAYFPEFDLQQLSLYGVGTKWQSGLSPLYPSGYFDQFEINAGIKYQGAITIALAGFFKGVVGKDWSGQYPGCMRQYGIHSERDPEMWMLAILQNAVDYRMEIKYSEERTGIKPSAAKKEFVTTAKAVINGAYGALAAKVPLGDPIAAAMVTCFARARIKWTIRTLEELGGRLVLTDTDSIMFYTDRTDAHKIYEIPQDILKQVPPDATEQLLSAVAIGEEISRRIPEGTILDLDSINGMFFVPPTTSPSDYNRKSKIRTKTAKKFIFAQLGAVINDDMQWECDGYDYLLTHYPDEPISFNRLKEASDLFSCGFPNYIGVRKNYIKLSWDAKKKSWGLKAKGKFVKRDRTRLEKQFQQRYVELFHQSEETAEEYYRVTLMSLMSGKYDIKDLTITRKIRKGEKKLIELGFGKEREEVSYYVGVGGEKVQSGKYDVMFYVEKLNKMHEEIRCLMGGIDYTKNEQPDAQLELVGVE